VGKAGGGDGAPEVGKLCLGRVPDLDGVGIVADEVLEVDCEGAAISLETLATGVDALGNVEDDGGKPIFIDPDFLVVGNLADLARERSVSERV
jgi:hypothetical protein